MGGAAMRSFDEIYARAAERKGGPAALEALIAEHRVQAARRPGRHRR